MNRFMLISFFAFAFFSQISGATVLVNAPPPAAQHLITDTGYGIFFAAAPTGALSLPSGAEVNKALGFQVIDTSNQNSVIYFDVLSNATTFPNGTVAGTQPVVTLSAGGSNAIPLTGSGSGLGPGQAPTLCNSSGTQTCQINGSDNISARYSAGSTLRISFTLSQLCRVTGSFGGSNICADSTHATVLIGPPDTLTQQITVSFSQINPSNPTNVGLTSSSETLSFTLTLTDLPPTISPPSGGSENYYSPGDSSIIINPGNYTLNANGGAPLQSLYVIGSRTNVPDISDGNTVPPVGAEVAGYINYTGNNLVVPSGDNSFSSFINTTNGRDYGYKLAIYAMSQAGIFSADAPAGTPPIHTNFPIGPGEGHSSDDGLVRSQKVNSVLTESKCFIATAAFHDGHAAPVMMLRQFRDQVLAKSELGRSFIRTYYHYSPAWAVWAWDKPIVRSVALHALAPVEFMAWAILKFTHAEQVESAQPYLDRIKKKLDEDDAAAGVKRETKESYSESIKKTLDPSPTPSSDSYVEDIKKKLPAEESSKGYSDRVKKDLPPEKDDGSVIAKVKSGQDKPHVLERPPIETIISFKFGVRPGMVVNNPASTVTFAQMYGGGVEGSFQPDLVLHYERLLFRSENFGSFGLGADLGISYAEGFGRYQFGFGSQNTFTSKTKFQFVQLPVTLNAIYRFNLFRIIRPYAGIGVGNMFFMELRTDKAKDRRSYTPIYTTMLGASMRIDGTDPDSAREGYLNNQIQHTSIYVEYYLLKSFTQSSINFERNGLYAGFMFEY